MPTQASSISRLSQNVLISGEQGKAGCGPMKSIVWFQGVWIWKELDMLFWKELDMNPSPLRSEGRRALCGLVWSLTQA